MTALLNEDTIAEAKALLEGAGYTVRRKAAPRGSATVTSITPGVRPDARTDRPKGLDKYETIAYVRGYAIGCMAFVRKHGTARGNTIEDMRRRTREMEWERHPAAHRKALAELARHRRLRS